MELLESIEKRHSVRSYEDREIDPATRDELSAFIQQCNQESGLHMQLVLNEPKAFGSFMAHYGTFSGVKNYIAVIGKKSASLEEQCGYYGEKVVLKAQQLGLNTCWTAMNQQKFTFILEENTVSLKAGIGFYTKVDLGIVKYHFEIGAGENNFHWTPSRRS